MMTPEEIGGTITRAAAWLVPLDHAISAPDPTFLWRRAGDAIARSDLPGFGFDGPAAVLNAVRDLVGDAEQSAMPHADVDALRNAYSAACQHFGLPLPAESEENRHEPIDVLEAAVAAAIVASPAWAVEFSARTPRVLARAALDELHRRGAIGRSP